MSNANLLDEAIRCVEAIGYDKTVEALKKAQFQEIKFDDERVKHVVETVAIVTGVPVYEIMYGNGRKNDRRFAIGFCVYYLNSPEFFNIDDMDFIKDQLNKESVSLCYKYSKEVMKLNPNHTSDRKFFDMKKKFDGLFKKKK